MDGLGEPGGVLYGEGFVLGDAVVGAGLHPGVVSGVDESVDAVGGDGEVAGLEWAVVEGVDGVGFE